MYNLLSFNNVHSRLFVLWLNHVRGSVMMQIQRLAVAASCEQATYAVTSYVQ